MPLDRERHAAPSVAIGQRQLDVAPRILDAAWNPRVAVLAPGLGRRERQRPGTGAEQRLTRAHEPAARPHAPQREAEGERRGAGERRELESILEDDPERPRHFITVRGSGYRFDP